jgi:hypothetical protein
MALGKRSRPGDPTYKRLNLYLDEAIIAAVNGLPRKVSVSKIVNEVFRVLLFGGSLDVDSLRSRLKGE